MKSDIYTANIKTVGTVLQDAKAILKKYIELKDIEFLREEVLDNNLILKSSKRRSEIVFYEIRRRYLSDQIEGYNESPLIYFVKNIDTEYLADHLLYLYLCKADRIIYEYITEVAFNKYKSGYLGITSSDTVDFIMNLAETDENIAKWSERTINDVRSGMMGVLKEFGYIHSRKRPKFSQVFLPSIIFYYVLYLNSDSIKTVEDLYHCSDLHLFFLSENEIKVLLDDAYRNEIIEFTPEDPNTLIYKYKDVKEILDAYINGEIQ